MRDRPAIATILGKTPKRGGIPPSDSMLKKSAEENSFLVERYVKLLVLNNLLNQNIYTRDRVRVE
jgi:hypothetical protein